MPKLLIIEDEFIIAEGIKLYFENNEYEVNIATNSESAINFLNPHEFDAVICDINLQEEVTGIDIVKKYHRLERHGPVVFLTAYSNVEVMEAAENLLPYAYVLKPFHNKQLLTTLNLAIANFRKDHTKNHTLSSLTETLTEREKEILEQLVYGKTNKEIGACLYISKFTVDTHLKHIKEKLNLHKKGELIKYVLLGNFNR